MMSDRLSVEGHVDRICIALLQVKSRAGKAEQPGICGILADNEDDAACETRRRRTVREAARVVVAEGAAGPVSDMDLAERACGVRHRRDRGLKQARDDNPPEHCTLPPQPKAGHSTVPRAHKATSGSLKTLRLYP